MSTTDTAEYYRLQRVKGGVADSEKLVGLLTEFVKKMNPDDTPHITALRKALTTTIIHLRNMKATGHEYAPSAELNNLWWEAADALQRNYPELADACRAKAFGWATEEDWDIAEQEGKKISIEDMKAALKRLVGEHAASVEEAKALKPEATDVTRFLPTWLMDEKKTKAVSFLAVGLGAVIGAAWAVFVFVSDKDSKASEARKQPTQPPITINNNNTNNNTVSPTISPQMNQNVIVSPPASPPLTLKASFDICQGEFVSSFGACGNRGSRFIPCGANVAEYIKKECEKFEFKKTLSEPGGHCGYTAYHVECTAVKQ